MVRAPCCEKMGLKKGPWSPEEDQILLNHISLYGHPNWRALPRQAGLLRCGKSCRLRWINYLRPDIKRGNFSKEEEDKIIELHDKLGNRWSAIASKLPGRTDNEIKNVWHTYLKKRLKPLAASRTTAELETPENDVIWSGGSCSDVSPIEMKTEAAEMEEEFWSEIFPADDFGGVTGWDTGLFSETAWLSSVVAGVDGCRSNIAGDDVDFWCHLLHQADQSLQVQSPDF